MKNFNNFLKYIYIGALIIFFSLVSLSNVFADDDLSKTLGIDCGGGKLTNGQCSFNLNAMIGKDKENGGKKNSLNDPMSFLKDIFFTSTMFITVLASMGLIYGGYNYIIAGADNVKKAEEGKNSIKYSLIGILIVIFSVAIVRLIQFIAAGNLGVS